MGLKPKYNFMCFLNIEFLKDVLVQLIGSGIPVLFVYYLQNRREIKKKNELSNFLKASINQLCKDFINIKNEHPKIANLQYDSLFLKKKFCSKLKIKYAKIDSLFPVVMSSDDDELKFDYSEIYNSLPANEYPFGDYENSSGGEAYTQMIYYFLNEFFPKIERFTNKYPPKNERFFDT